MAELQKEASLPGNSKQKNSMLDLDFGKDDFISSWKSMSITEDDTMNLDFGPVSKGKKTAFNFDKADLDFNLDGDFGKIPSFNLDIPDIDISSPLKKDGKSKERSSQESASGNTQGKSDRFEFTFDFGELDGLNFKSSSKEEDVKVNKGEDKEDSSKRRVSHISRDCLAEDVDTHERGNSRNLPASGELIIPNIHAQVGAGISSDSSNENCLSKFTRSHEGHPNSVVNQGASREAMSLLEKTTSPNNQELDSQLSKSIAAGPFSQEVFISDETIQAESVHTVLRNESSRDTALELQQEVSPGDTRVSNQHITSSVKDNEGSQVCTSNHAFVADKEGADPALGGSDVGKFVAADTSRESVPNKRSNMTNQDPLEFSTSPLNRTTDNNLMPEKESKTGMRSKYFKQPDKTVSRFQNTPNQTTLSSMHDSVISTRQPCPLDERNCNSVDAKRDGMLAGVSSSSSGALIGKEHSHIEGQECSKHPMTNRPLEQDLNNGKPASKEADKKLKTPDSFSSLVRPSSLSALTNKFTSQKCANPASQAMTVETSQTCEGRAAEEAKVSSSKAIKKMPILPSLTISNLGANLDSSKSIPQKEIILSRDMQKHGISAGSGPSKTTKVVETKKPSPPIPSLKRKIVEASNTDLISKPSKRLSQSPRKGNSEETLGQVAEKEAWSNENVVAVKSINECKSQQNSKKDVPWHMNELEVPFSIESDGNIENAEACSKGLEDICNMLRKKHEEAKEVLVRAVVNNNKLLMLNHPIYEEKISFLVY
ncbi:hypothetical protein ACH5RR_015254 [Cinchona calisaya]|uniref:Uncharacterized protein n=1 Tax=Cinchona calisaya TaxID=153742 RepID=A0ABD2ZW32_9GENT